MENKLKHSSKEKFGTEQFAMKLNVSEQAVSNWENKKSLDIESTYFDVTVFQISLDYLIKKENEMNNTYLARKSNQRPMKPERQV